MPAQPVGSSIGGQGKAVPVEETMLQLCLPIATAENPKGATRRRTRDRLGAVRAGVPKAIVKAERATSATMDGHRRPRPAATCSGAGMIRGRKPAGGGGHNPSSRGAVYDQRTYGSVGAGAGNCPGYPTPVKRPARLLAEVADRDRDQTRAHAASLPDRGGSSSAWLPVAPQTHLTEHSGAENALRDAMPEGRGSSKRRGAA